MKRIAAIIFFLIVTITVNAQNTKPAFYFLPQVALLNGDHAVSSSVQMSGGVNIKKIAVGFGVAMDYYKLRTVPLFAEMRISHGSKNKVFSYINAGANMLWPLETQYPYHWTLQAGNVQDNFTTGFYGDVGVGYAFNGASKKGVMMSIGYSVKTAHQSYRETIYTGATPSLQERKLDYTFNRIALRIGMGL